MTIGLSVWDKQEIKLSFWDSRNGDDIHFILQDDGTVLMETIEDEGEETKVVNLVDELRKIAMCLDSDMMFRIQKE